MYGRNTLFISVLFVLTAGCDTPVSFSPVPIPPPPPVVVPKQPTYNAVLRTLQPALAVRGIKCIICHSTVTANIVSDFGYPDDFFIAPSQADTNSPLYNSLVANDDSSWKYSWYDISDGSWSATSGTSVTGQVSMPNQVVAQFALNNFHQYVNPEPALPTNLTLPQFFTSSVYNGYQASASITAPAGSQPTLSAERIFIKAPTTQEVLNLIPAWASMPSPPVGFVPIAAPGNSAKATNLVVAGSSTGFPYVTNYAFDASDSSISTHPFVCYGDIVINGVLLLNNPIVQTDSNGCRLYVAGSVFLQGIIQYSNTSNGSNLQISSSRAVFLGVGVFGSGHGVGTGDFLTSTLSGYPAGTFNSYTNGGSTRSFCQGSGGGPQDCTNSSGLLDPLWTRLIEGSRNGLMRPGSDYANWLGIQKLIWNVDRNVLYQNGIKVSDSRDLPSSLLPTAQTYQFTGLLLNAPVVISQFVGNFKGAIIADWAHAVPGTLNFSFDPIFNTTPTLPYLPFNIIEVE